MIMTFIGFIEKSFKWIFLSVFIFGGYNFYVILFEINEVIKISVGQASANVAIVLDNTNRTITELYSKVNDIQSKTIEVIEKADENRDFGNEILNFIAKTDCMIGKKALVFRWSLKNKQTCLEWAADARKVVRVAAYTSYNEEEMISYIAKTMLGGNWFIEIPDSKAIPLREWIKHNFKPA
ncbi:MAG: hypothetical protein V7707_08030 [Motiliproteus sp.]